MRAAIVGRGITVESADDLNGVLGTSAGGRIQVLNGLSPAEEFVVLAHEYAHELLHRADDRPASLDARELEAEARPSSSVKPSGLIRERPVATYLHLYHGNREALTQSLGRIQRAVSVVLTGIRTAG